MPFSWRHALRRSPARHSSCLAPWSSFPCESSRPLEQSCSSGPSTRPLMCLLVTWNRPLPNSRRARSLRVISTPATVGGTCHRRQVRRARAATSSPASLTELASSSRRLRHASLDRRRRRASTLSWRVPRLPVGARITSSPTTSRRCGVSPGVSRPCARGARSFRWSAVRTGLSFARRWRLRVTSSVGLLILWRP